MTENLRGSEFLVFPHCVVDSVKNADVYSSLQYVFNKNFVKSTFALEDDYRNIFEMKVNFCVFLSLKLFQIEIFRNFRQINVYSITFSVKSTFFRKQEKILTWLNFIVLFHTMICTQCVKYLNFLIPLISRNIHHIHTVV